MKNDIKLKGQLRFYMQCPLLMIILLAFLNVWIFFVDRKAGAFMAFFVVIYGVLVGSMYYYSRTSFMADMVEFAAQYGIVQNTLLKELTIPYAILLADGKVIWSNTQFRQVLGFVGRKEIKLR